MQPGWWCRSIPCGKHYRGPITVFTTRPESHDIGRMIAEDERLGIELVRFDESQGGSNSTYLTKPRRDAGNALRRYAVWTRTRWWLAMSRN